MKWTPLESDLFSEEGVIDSVDGSSKSEVYLPWDKHSNWQKPQEMILTDIIIRDGTGNRSVPIRGISYLGMA